MGIPESVAELLGPVVANLGVDLVDVEHNGAVLRLVVDTDSGINTDTLARINRLVSPMLDEHDPISARYTLEVTSPGVERKLRTIPHYERSVGEVVLLKLIPTAEVRRIKGELVEVVGTDLRVRIQELDGVEVDVPEAEAEVRTIAHDDILKARTVFKWGPAPKLGGSKPGKSKKSGSGKKKQTNKQGSGSSTPGTQDRGTA